MSYDNTWRQAKVGGRPCEVRESSRLVAGNGLVMAVIDIMKDGTKSGPYIAEPLGDDDYDVQDFNSRWHVCPAFAEALCSLQCAHDASVKALEAVVPCLGWSLTHQPGNFAQTRAVMDQVEATLTQAKQ